MKKKKSKKHGFFSFMSDIFDFDFLSDIFDSFFD